jgi:hypothetical protein
MHRRVRSLTLILLSVGFAIPASAATITLDAVSRGSYRSDTGAFGTGFAGTSDGNYLTGLHLLSGPAEYRSFFLFDLSTVTDTIVAATFDVTLVGMFTDTGSETVAFYDISDPIRIGNNTAGAAGFSDLGSGTMYGSRTFTPADPAHDLLPIALNAAAVADMNAATSLFGFGGALTSITPGVYDQTVFWFSDFYPVRLVLETEPASAPVPEPSSLLLLSAGAAGLVAKRRALRQA